MSEQDDAGLYQTPTRWPYRLEGLITGIPVAVMLTKLFGAALPLTIAGIGLMLVIGMQYGGITR